ncbi:MAG TPA: DegT/DnrJ/EryC1/StrS family aminotransferase, partial [Flavisolibacter sp.]|nr:DegT/DnrJ/EryC1/StrS family aminotransferase [Flavisolibacter sp.]
FHQYTILVEGVDRDGLIDYLAQQGIPSKIYYPLPMHRQKVFASLRASSTHLPVTDWLTERIVSLPIHTEMDEEQLQFITRNVLDYIR